MIRKPKFFTWITTLFVIALTMTVMAKPSESLVKMKTGPCKFVLLDSRGVAPLSGWSLALTSPENGQALLQAKTDQNGACELDVTPGRYIVRVDNMDLAILDAQADQTISECRIVVPEKPLLAGGEASASGTGGEGGTEGAAPVVTGGNGLTPFIVGGAVILAGAGGYAIYDNNNDDDDDSPPPPPPPTTTRPKSKPRPVSQ
ncbi:MAG: hypothetical protein K8T26_08535 [Lentisphaerae bacterium]|nr:hypothetical protein [Lentisphaerota bacterium]